MHLGLPPSSLVLPPPTPATMQLLRQGGFAIGPTSAIPQGASRSGGDHVRSSPRVCSSATTSSLSANPTTTSSPSLSVDIPSPVIDIGTGLLPNGGRVYEMPAPRHADVVRVVRTNDLPLVTPLPVPVSMVHHMCHVPWLTFSPSVNLVIHLAVIWAQAPPELLAVFLSRVTNPHVPVSPIRHKSLRFRRL